MKLTTVYNKSRAYILANDKPAKDLSDYLIDEFMQNEKENYIFIIYHVKDTIILFHFKKLKSERSFQEALKSIKKDITEGNLCCNDKQLKARLGDPQASTANFLLDYIASEEQNL